ncbi:MAG: hypothetical protein SCALA702_05150 [Melioribacteraceae bacterium]|nr:MAG: hypothetical protein SCALA702_05150 [Melioribacteraceae bacterium]
MTQESFESNLYGDHGMVREYDTHRIPEDALVDWENEYLTYCSGCRKDLIISKDMPKMVYYCRSCREEILVETGQVHASSNRNKSSEFISSRMLNIKSSVKNFNRAIIAILFALLALVIMAALEITRVNQFSTTLWIIFSIFIVIALVHLTLAILQKIAEKKRKKLTREEMGYEKLNGS